ncbi:MAG: outer membrane beta-barrel protein [Muribaculaceae bacterium]
MKSYLITLFMLIAYASGVSAQTSVYQGTVVDHKGQPLHLANVVLLSASDSLYIDGTTTDSLGHFRITALPQKAIIKASHLGFNDRLINAEANTVPQHIMLTPDTIRLGEVMVKASRPVTCIEGDALATTIRGTMLENIGSAKDVLGYLPGIININGAIEVLGKGAPTYYVNGRKVRSLSELDALKSKKIKRVELVLNPGARYASATNAVIRIIADREPGEGISLDNTLKLGIQDYLIGDDQLNLNYRNGNLDVFTNLQYGYNKSKASNTSIQNTWLEQHTQQTMEYATKTKSQVYDAQIGFDYTFSPTSSTGVYYKVGHTPSRNRRATDAESRIDGIIDEISTISQHTSIHNTSHLVDGYYNGKFNKFTIFANFDFLWKTTDEDLNSNEFINDSDRRNLTTASNIDSRMIAAEVHVSHPLLKGNINFGAEIIHSHRADDFSNIEQYLNNNSLTIDETTSAGYAQLVQQLGRTSLQVGLRYEHIDSRYREYGVLIPEQSRVYDKLLPSANINLPLGKNWLQLSYAYKYKRPLYSQLSSRVIYLDRNLYESGNPLLRNEYMHKLSAVYQFGKFMFESNYSFTDGKIITTIGEYHSPSSTSNQGTTLLKKDNSPYDLHELNAFLVYMPQFGRYFGMLSAGMTTQFYKIDYRGALRRMNNPMAMVVWRNILALPHSTRVEASMTWISEGQGENIDLGSRLTTNASVTKNFNSHWQVKLSYNGLFNTGHKRHYTFFNDCRDIYVEQRHNTRGVECSVRYMLNITKKKYKGKGAGNTEKTRF